MKKAGKGGGLDDCSPANAGDPSDLKSDGTNKGYWEAAWDTVMTGSAAGRAKGIRLVCGLMQNECDVATVTRMCASSSCLLHCDLRKSQFTFHESLIETCQRALNAGRAKGIRFVCGLMQSECDVATVTRMCASSKCMHVDVALCVGSCRPRPYPQGH